MAIEVTIDDGKYVFTVPDGDYRVHIARHGSPWVVVSEGSKAIGTLLYCFHEALETLRSFTTPRAVYEKHAGIANDRTPFEKLEYICSMPSHVYPDVPHSHEDTYRYDHPRAADEKRRAAYPDEELYSESDLDGRGDHPYALTYADLRSLREELKQQRLRIAELEMQAMGESRQCATMLCPDLALPGKTFCAKHQQAVEAMMPEVFEELADPPPRAHCVEHAGWRSDCEACHQAEKE